MKPYKGFSPVERIQGQRVIEKAVAEGRYPKAERCSSCGQKDGRLDYHADDYNLETILEQTRILCYNCHITHHILHNNPNNQGAHFYEIAVQRGRIFPPNNGNIQVLFKHYKDLQNEVREHLDKKEKNRGQLG